MPEHPSRSEDEADIGERTGSVPADPSSPMTTGSHDRGHSGQLALVLPLPGRRRLVTGRGGNVSGIRQGFGGQREVLALGCLDDAEGAPAHAEVGLDGAFLPHRSGDVALDGRVLALRSEHRINIGRRPTDVNDHDVLTAHVREQLDTSQDCVGRRRPDQLGEPTAARQALATDDVLEERRPDCRPCRVRCDDADAG